MNAGTTAETNSPGTTDNQALEFKVNSARALRLERATSPYHIGSDNSSRGNSDTFSAVGVTIARGGSSSQSNTVTDKFGTVGSGRNNGAGDNAGTPSNDHFATVAGGESNVASGQLAVTGPRWLPSRRQLQKNSRYSSNFAAGHLGTTQYPNPRRV